MGLASLQMFGLFREDNKPYIDAWMKASVVWTALLFGQLEIMSLFHGVNFVTVFLFWGGVNVALAILLYKKYGKSNQKNPKIVFTSWLKNIWKVIWEHKFFTVILGILMAFSFITVPYNWDSMTYHLARIANWAENQSVGHYATHIIRQLSSPVLAEFVDLHVYILSGERDYLVNLVQGFSCLTNAWIVYEISKKIGCSRRFCNMSVLLFVSMPIVFGEALTTQVDHFSALWLLIFSYYMLDFWNMEQKLEYNDETKIKCLLLAACVGLGYMAKPSVSVGMFVMAVILLGVCIARKDSALVIIKLLGIVIPVMLVLLLPEMIRNILSFGGIQDPSAGAKQLPGTLKPSYLFVNELKNFMFNLPNSYMKDSSHYFAAVVYAVAAILKVEIDDPSISENGRQFSLGQPKSYGHDSATNPVLLFTAILCFAWYLYRRKKNTQIQRYYTCTTVFMFILICVLIRWEPYVSRYMLSYLALLCPMAALQMQDFTSHFPYKNYREAFVVIASFLCVIELASLIEYHGRIIWYQKAARPEGYFVNRELGGEYAEIVDYIHEKGYADVGIIFDEDMYEYPLWQMLDRKKVQHIVHVNVKNSSEKYENMAYIPDVVITSDTTEKQIKIHGVSYVRTVEKENVQLYEKDEQEI